MVFALAGDSTIDDVHANFSKQRGINNRLAEGYQVAGVTLDSSRQFQFEEQRGDRGRR